MACSFLEKTHMRRGEVGEIRFHEDTWGRALSFLATGDLLRLSECDKKSHATDVSAELFLSFIDGCVHCGTPFVPIDNRVEGCLEIYTKRGRRHKGGRAASWRELRNAHELIANRRRITSGTWHPVCGASARETCDGCRKSYLAWSVADAEWQSNVPSAERHRTLCLPCYLGKAGQPTRWLALALLIFSFSVLLLRALLAPGGAGGEL